MNILRLMWMEIIHRKLTFFIACLAILIIGRLCRQSDDAHSCAVATAPQQRVAALDDEIRKITKAMGFNINILPSQQNLADFHANDFAEKTMPYEYVAAAGQQYGRREHPPFAAGADSEADLAGVSAADCADGCQWSRAALPSEKPEAVWPSRCRRSHDHIGHVLAAELKLQEGSDVQLQNRSFRVGKVYPPRGNKDDITVWIDLPAAQELLDLPGQINLIQALECNCATIDRLAEIEREISTRAGQRRPGD